MSPAAAFIKFLRQQRPEFSLRGLLVLSILFLVVLRLAFAQDRDYDRCMVVSDRGIVATSQVLASQAGAQILAQGGSAIDAGITANAVLGVAEPMMNGISGDRHRYQQDRTLCPVWSGDRMFRWSTVTHQCHGK